MAKLGKPRRLTAEQVEAARRRVQLWTENQPKAVARELGIARNTLRNYLSGRHKGPA